MNPKTVVALGVVAVVVLVLALVFGRHASDPESHAETRLVPGLHEQVNEIEAIDIIHAEGDPAVRLRRERERWRVREKSDYEADFDLVHDLLRDLAAARRSEERTSNPDWHSTLGVSDPEAGGQGVVVAFPETDLPEVILGQIDRTEFGRYARLRGESQSWLTDRAPEIPRTPLEWLQRAIMDIPASELTEITLRHPDGETVHLRPAGEEDGQWVLMNVPEGRQAVPAWEISPTTNALARLNLEDVRPNEAIPDDAVSALFVTRDGLNFIARVFADDDRYWAQFSVSAETAASEDEELDDEAAELAIDAAAADDRLSPWQFAIPRDRFDQMTRRVEDLLVDPDDDPEA